MNGATWSRGATQQGVMTDNARPETPEAGHGTADERLRITLQQYKTHTVPALEIDAYAQQVYQSNQSSGL